MAECLEPVVEDDLFGRVEIIHLNPDMVERLAFGETLLRPAIRVYCEVILIITNVSCCPTVKRRAAPTFFPAQQFFKQSCAAINVAYRDVDVFNLAMGHVHSP